MLMKSYENRYFMAFLKLKSTQGVSAQKNGYGAQNGHNNGYGTPDGYDSAATDFLTEARIRRAKPKERPYKLRDGGASAKSLSLRDCQRGGGNQHSCCSASLG